MLAGIDPEEVDSWYLGIYIDAVQWVELPNTRGMSQYADGGIVASKPYAASGNYISKMSDYCSSCHYNVKEVTTQRACPFNSLYWHFMHKHRDVLMQKTLAPTLCSKAGIEKQRTNVVWCFKRPKKLSILLKRYRDFNL